MLRVYRSQFPQSPNIFMYIFSKKHKHWRYYCFLYSLVFFSIRRRVFSGTLIIVSPKSFWSGVSEVGISAALRRAVVPLGSNGAPGEFPSPTSSRHFPLTTFTADT